MGPSKSIAYRAGEAAGKSRQAVEAAGGQVFRDAAAAEMPLAGSGGRRGRRFLIYDAGRS
jgi:hypothetical protein